MRPVPTNRRSPAKVAFGVWSGLSLLVIASIVFIGLRWGDKGFELFIQQWAFTHQPTTLAGVALSWLLAGFFLYLLAAGRVHAGNLFTLAGFALVSLSYLNTLRERFRYGDLEYYIQAARHLKDNLPLPDTYFYPPLWANLMEFIVHLTDDNILLVIWLLNVLALFAFYFLLHRVLEHYGFSPRLAALFTTGFMLVNTPLLRTLVYTQVNLHVMNAVFLSLLLFRRKPALSALMLALAVHLKASPAVLVLAFLLERNWRWLLWFGLGVLLFGSLTLAMHGLAPFQDFLYNALVLGGQARSAIFHDSSFDSLLAFPTERFGVNATLIRTLVYAAKAGLGLAALIVLVKSVRARAYFEKQEAGWRASNALPPLFILMNLASPIVWEHHGIFLALSFLLLLKRIETPGQWLWFGLAYLLEFAIPTFDFYPWSYGRLVAPLIILWQMWIVPEKPSAWFGDLNRWLEALPAMPARTPPPSAPG